MSNEQPTPPPSDTPALSSALRELGQSLAEVIEAVMRHPQVQTAKDEMVTTLHEIAGRLQNQVHVIEDDPRFQEAGERGRQMIDQARQNKAVAELQEKMIHGLGVVNEQLRRFSDSIKIEPETPPPAGPEIQRVSIEQEPAATGETTRLDTDK